jgi:hypothetical protein
MVEDFGATVLPDMLGRLRGMIPEGLSPLPRSTLPRLADAEFVLDQRLDNTDQVVAAFGSILSRAAPRIIQQLAENQRLLRSGQAKANP